VEDWDRAVADPSTLSPVGVADTAAWSTDGSEASSSDGF